MQQTPISIPGFHTPRAAALVAAVLLAACATPPEQVDKDRADSPQLLWPAPPDRPRFTYEFRLRSEADIAIETEEQRLKRNLTGQPPPNEPAFDKPGGIAARNGRIYVTDTVNRVIVVFDVPRRKLFRFGIREPGNLSKPVAIALDSAMNVYVMDATRRQVLVYDSLGLFQRAVGNPKELERPTGVAVDPAGERIYVVDRSTNESDRHRVVAYGRNGEMLFEIGQRGRAEGEFNVPLQATVANDGTLYVLDAGNFRIQAFSPDGRFLRAFGKVGDRAGDLARPRGLATDSEGNVYITDGSFGNFQIFNSGGELLLSVGGAGTGDAPGRFGLPGGIAVDETGRIYVADQLFNKVEVYRRLSEREADTILTAPPGR